MLEYAIEAAHVIVALVPTAPWLDRYLEPDPIRVDGAFHRFATRRVSDGAACVVVVPAPGAEPLRAREALSKLAHAHHLVSHPNVPHAAPLQAHDGMPFVELACDATIDGIELLSRLMRTRTRFAYSEVEALVDALQDAVKCACAEGVTLGRVSLGSLLASPNGQLWLLGFGHSIAVEDEQGSIATAHAVFQANEIALGARPSHASDLMAIWLLRASLLSHTHVPDALSRVLRGEASIEDETLATCVRELDAKERWSDFAQAETIVARMRACLATTPDPDGLAQTVSDLVLGIPSEALWSGALDEPTEESVALGPDSEWIDRGGHERIKLGASLRRLLNLLLRWNDEDPGRSVATWELLDAGWPGETMLPEAGANRVYAAISRLRNMGLRGSIERHDEGYRIAPLARITRIRA